MPRDGVLWRGVVVGTACTLSVRPGAFWKAWPGLFAFFIRAAILPAAVARFWPCGVAFVATAVRVSAAMVPAVVGPPGVLSWAPAAVAGVASWLASWRAFVSVLDVSPLAIVPAVWLAVGASCGAVAVF